MFVVGGILHFCMRLRVYLDSATALIPFKGAARNVLECYYCSTFTPVVSGLGASYGIFAGGFTRIP